MSLDADFVNALEPIHPKALMEQLRSVDRPHFNTYWTFKNEIRPLDLYCYLYARFGPPNGIQNFLRGDHSGNVIHWEWALRSQGRIVLLQGHNFRSEIWISGEELPADTRDVFISALKGTFPACGPAMGRVRRALEHWVEFVNPYQRIRRAIDSLTKELDALNIDQGLEQGDFHDFESPQAWVEEWERQGNVFSRATGLCFGIRSMLPVMAEAFVNLVLYMLMKPALKKDDRLRDNLIRQPIDVRIRSLAHNCSGFKTDVDYSADACRRYHSLVNERNDLLHGNVVVDKLKFNEIYFNGRVPVFPSYSTMWDRAFGIEQRSVGLELVKDEREIVEGLIGYIVSCIQDDLQGRVRLVSERYELGMCLHDGRLGVLFSGQLVDTRLGPKVENSNNRQEEGDR